MASLAQWNPLAELCPGVTHVIAVEPQQKNTLGEAEKRVCFVNGSGYMGPPPSLHPIFNVGIAAYLVSLLFPSCHAAI